MSLPLSLLSDIKHNNHKIKLLLQVIFFESAIVFCLFPSLLAVDVIVADDIASFIDELKHNKHKIKLQLRVIFLVAATVSCLLLSLLAVDAAAAIVLG